MPDLITESLAIKAEAGTPGIRFYQENDEGTIFMSLQPRVYDKSTVGSEPAVKRWNWAISTPHDFSGNGDRPDRILGWGYNVGVDAGGQPTPHEQSDDACFGETFEDYYNIVSTSVRQFEWYIQSTPAGDTTGVHQVRPIMATIQYESLLSTDQDPSLGLAIKVSGTDGLAITAKARFDGSLTTRTSNTVGTITVLATDLHLIITTSDTFDLFWQGGTRTGCTISASTFSSPNSLVSVSGGSGDNLPAQDTAIRLVKNNAWSLHNSSANGLHTMYEVTGKSGILWENNVPCLKQKTSSGTPKNLIWLDSSNFMYLGEGGIAQIQTGAFLRVWAGLSTAYSTNASFTDSDCTGTVNDGAIGMTYNGGTTKLWGRSNGTWKSVTLT